MDYRKFKEILDKCKFDIVCERGIPNKIRIILPNYDFLEYDLPRDFIYMYLTEKIEILKTECENYKLKKRITDLKEMMSLGE